MVTSRGDSQGRVGSGMAGAGPLVAFDFDGTLTTRDCFMGFLRWRSGRLDYLTNLARLAPDVVSYGLRRDKGELKTAAVRTFLCGLPREQLDAEAQAFADESAADLFRPDALEAWRRHRADGARLMIVSASPETIVGPIARILGADLLIGTRLRFDRDERVAGDFVGENCRGPEKVRRIRETLGPDVRLAAAYGDTDGDTDMLAMADQPFMRLFVGAPQRGARAV